MKRSLGTVLLLGMLMLGVAVLSGCGSGTTGTTAAGKVSTAEKVSAKVGTRENPIPVGQSARFGDWAITLTKVNTNATVSADNVYEAKAAGNRYMIVSMTAAYSGAKSGSVMGDLDVQFVGSKGNTFGTASSAHIDNNIDDQGEMYKGASVSGDRLFVVPADQITGGTVEVSDAFSMTGETLFFAIDASTKDNGTTTTLAGQAAPEGYKTAMKAWHDEFAPKLSTAVEALNISDVTNASSSQIKAVQECQKVLEDAVSALKKITPPSNLVSAHDTYMKGVERLTLGVKQLAEGLKKKSATGTLDAYATISSLNSDPAYNAARSTLESALGFKLSSD